MKQRLDIFKRKQRAYQDLFNLDNPAARIVMNDLKRFCRFEASTFSTDNNVQSYQNGKRDVLERILQNVHFDLDTLHKIKEE